MNSNINSNNHPWPLFWRSLDGERLKYRRTPALWLALGGPLAVGLLFVLVFTLSPAAQLPNDKKWGIFLDNLFSVWSLLMLPMGAVLVAALAMGLEHGDNQLKQMLTLPPPRWALYGSKVLAGLGLTLLACGLMGLVCLLLGLVLGFTGPAPWSIMLQLTFIPAVAAWPIVTLTVWLASRWKSFVVPLSVGVFGTFVGIIAIRSAFYWQFVLWAYPIKVSNIILAASIHTAAQGIAHTANDAVTLPALWATLAWPLGLAGLVGTLWLALGLLDFSGRDIT
jgi:lantibiotic transport system permease protein